MSIPVDPSLANILDPRMASSIVHGHGHQAAKKPQRLAADIAFCFLLIAVVEFLAIQNALPIYVQMMLITCAIVYLGCRFALLASLNPAMKNSIETMTEADVKRFPIVGSCVLFSLYLLFKFANKALINLFIKGFFFVFGVIVLGQKISMLLEGFLPVAVAEALINKQWKIKIPEINIPFPEINISIPFVSALFEDTAADKEKKAKQRVAAAEPVDISVLDIFSLLMAAVVGYFYLTTSHWLLSNVFGVCFCLQGIESIGLGSYFNGFILLVGLFFYDIFWVFGTDVMVTVAKNFDAPAVLFFPQMGEGRPSMLGLGDIVIPGIFIALLMRFDYARNQAKGTTGYPYFNYTLFAYFLGLSATVGVMYHFLAAQPALLYLVPACLGASLGLAAVRGEVPALWNYVENAEEQKKE